MELQNDIGIIHEKLAILSTEIRLRGKFNMLDINVLAETFFAELMNHIYGYQLKNINLYEQNAKAIDLIDTENKIIVQVSSDNSKGKVQSSLSGIKEEYKQNNYHFIFISISEEVTKLKEKSFEIPEGIIFDPKNDCLDNKKLITHIESKGIECIKRVSDYLNKTVVYSDRNSAAPDFKFYPVQNLIARDKEADNLFDKVITNRIFNLVGIGGSGKSSLAYLMMQKHESDFNEIANVVVNNNIKNDFIEQINKTLKLEFVRNEDAFSEIITYLQNNFTSVHPNLLVLDINETSDKTKNDEIIHTIIKNKDIINGWKILILSREKVDTRNRIDTHNLNDNEDVEFLKELFLQKAGERYNNFGDFAELFKIVFYNPLLTEQLALYLHNDPDPATIEDIKKILYGASFKEEDMQGLSADRHDETIVSFLTNLIKYNDFNDNEKNLLRHFVLWQAEYIGYEVIKNLLNGVFASDDDLKNTLKSLSKRAILDTNNNQTLGYKLHGLLAESLREQIDVEKQDYSVYLNNISDLIKNQDFNFIPYADCIGNSLCEYDIVKETNILGQIAFKYYKIWKTDYAFKLYNKCLLLLKDSPRKENRAIILNLLACLQSDQLFDYESAEKNYKKAISIGIDITRNSTNTLFLEILAEAYNNLANLQSDWLNETKSANINYKKASSIKEKSTKISNDNPEYLNKLAGSYNNLAILQLRSLDNSKSASQYFKKAIQIYKKITAMSDSIESLSDLASAYMNYANYESDNLQDYESANKHYNMTIEIKEKIANQTNNIDYQLSLAQLYQCVAIFQKNQLQNPKLAEQNFEKEITIREKLSTLHHRFVVDMIDSKIKFAQFYFDNQKYKEAQSIITEIKPTFKELVLKDPNNHWVKEARIVLSILNGELNGTSRTVCTIYPE